MLKILDDQTTKLISILNVGLKAMALNHRLRNMYINSKQINRSSNIENKSKLEESLNLYIEKTWY